MRSDPNIIVIGVSTGGPMTLKQIFSGRDPLNAAVIIVLHIASGMDRLIAKGLASVSSMPVSPLCRALPMIFHYKLSC